MVRIDKSFVTVDYQKQDSDIIYKLKMGDADVYFYVLLEMQSDVDHSMPFRILRYMVELLADIFRNTDEDVRIRKGFRLPAIVPIILYNGAKNWTVVKSYREYTDNYEIFGDNIINFNYLFFDLNRTDEDFILSTRELLDIVFSLDIIRTDINADEMTNQLVNLVSGLNDYNIAAFVRWFKKVFCKGDVPPKFEEQFIQALKEKEVGNMTHAIERWRDRQEEQWRNKGKLEATIESAIRMIKEGLSFETIKRVTELPDDELNRLMNP